MSHRAALIPLLVVALHGATTARINAQQVVMDSARLVAIAREQTRVYQDVDKAVLAGYRPVGPHSPTMGQHWINPAWLFPAVPDPAKPGILSYLTIGNRKMLVGVAYAAPAVDGVMQPNTLAEARHWHVHAGKVLDEGFFLEHENTDAGSGHQHNVSGIGVLHLWIWTDNPDGLFAANNWTLPYMATGIDPSSYTSRDAARALATASAGSPFLLEQMRRVGSLSEADVRLLEQELTRTARNVKEIIQKPRDANDRQTSELVAAAWRSMWPRLARAMPPAKYDLLRTAMK